MDINININSVEFTNFTNETSIVFLLLIKYLKDRNIGYVQKSNTIIISRIDFNQIKYNLEQELL